MGHRCKSGRSSTYYAANSHHRASLGARTNVLGERGWIDTRAVSYTRNTRPRHLIRYPIINSAHICLSQHDGVRQVDKIRDRLVICYNLGAPTFAEGML